MNLYFKTKEKDGLTILEIWQRLFEDRIPDDPWITLNLSPEQKKELIESLTKKYV